MAVRLSQVLSQLLAKPRRLYTGCRSLCSATASSTISLSFIVNDDRFRQYMNRMLEDYQHLQSLSINNSLTGENKQRLLEFSAPSQLYERVKAVEGELAELAELCAIMEKEEDRSMKELLREEQLELKENRDQCLFSVAQLCVPLMHADDITDVILEIYAGVGGQEAGLFAYQLYTMYERLCLRQGWNVSLFSIQKMEVHSSLKSINKVELQISGHNVYRLLKFESGIHRVQRVPNTEKGGRMHTSTAVVVVLPKPQDIDIVLEKKDIKVDTFKSRGAGGQSVNTTDSAVRVTHLPTGTVVECQRERSQIANRKLALEHLKCRLYNNQLTEQETKTKNMRRLQIGGANRNEKIRTYNFPQDRVTDHRVKRTVSDVTSFLSADSVFTDFLSSLVATDEQERLLQWLESLQLQSSSVPTSSPV